jgi:hypothetical protein
MEAQNVVSPPASWGYTSYLVSIFRSSAWARLAFDTRWQMWYQATSSTAPPALHLGLGTHGREALFHSFSPHPYLAELFFQRGSILVEVFQGMDQGSPTDLESSALYAIATELGSLARQHPHRA